MSNKWFYAVLVLWVILMVLLIVERIMLLRVLVPVLTVGLTVYLARTFILERKRQREERRAKEIAEILRGDM